MGDKTKESKNNDNQRNKDKEEAKNVPNSSEVLKNKTTGESPSCRIPPSKMYYKQPGILGKSKMFRTSCKRRLTFRRHLKIKDVWKENAFNLREGQAYVQNLSFHERYCSSITHVPGG